ncbi:hypothetical protein CW304_26385 [Bacillus sp. UFRGS-B20]|nr:hypothetical protein CW304_26385 [Bacillus sp. UFRGS-B20]
MTPPCSTNSFPPHPIPSLLFFPLPGCAEILCSVCMTLLYPCTSTGKVTYTLLGSLFFPLQSGVIHLTHD